MCFRFAEAPQTPRANATAGGHDPGRSDSGVTGSGQSEGNVIQSAGVYLFNLDLTRVSASDRDDGGLDEDGERDSLLQIRLEK